MSKMGLMKGKRGEREVIKLLQPVIEDAYLKAGYADQTPILRRNLMQSIDGGFDITGLHWLALEVKFHETSQLSSWWDQCKSQAGENQEPVLIHRKSHQPWRVRMFGALPLPDGRKVRCPVDISVESFLVYVQHRLLQELALGAAQG